MAEVVGAWHNADEFARAALGELGAGRRTLAFVFDPALLLPWPEDGAAEVVDSIGDRWRVLGYRGNDMALRARLEPGRRTAIWVRPAPGEQAATIDVTTLADLLNLADAFLDASPAGMLSTLLPGIPLPPDIAAWAPRSVQEPLPFARALSRVAQQHHGAVGKRHVLAAAVCAAGRQIPPALTWLDDGSLGRLVASYVHLLAVDSSLPVHTAAAEQLRLVASLLPGTLIGREPAILQAPSEALLDLIYALAAARRHGLPDPLAAIVNHGLAADLTWLLADQGELRAVLLEAADCLNADPDGLRALAQAVERRFSPPRLRQLQALLAPAAQNWPAERIAGVRLALLLQVIEAGPGPDIDSARTQLEEPVGARRLVQAAEGLLRVGRLLARLAVVPSTDPAQLALDDLVDLYVEHLATLEYDTAEARRSLQAMVTALGEQRKLAARLGELSETASMLLEAANRRLGVLLQADSSALVRSPRSLHRWLPGDIIPRSEGERGRRLWVLVFDGLRWDLWERVLLPKLESLGWTAATRAGLACLPSETAFCRRTLLGGRPPSSWLSDAFPSEEALLRACLAERVTDGDPLVYRLKAELGDDVGAAPAIGKVNAWVYRTPDRLAHHADGSLADVAFQFAAFLDQNVLPELSELIGADDLVYLGTDHGFLSASAQEVLTLSVPAELVHDRYLEVQGGEAAPAGVDVRYGERRYRVATGDTLFRPLTAHSPLPGFRHGGATLQELVIPLVELRLPARSSGALRLTLAGPATLEEDATEEFTVRLSNGAEDAVRGQLVIDTNLGRESALPMQLQPGAEQERRRTVVGREGLEWVRVQVILGNTVLATATQRVQVTLKAGIRITGMEKLDEW